MALKRQSIAPGSPKIPDDFFLKREQVIVGIYGRAQTRIDKLLASQSLTEFQQWRYFDLQRQINETIKSADQAASVWSASTARDAYRRGLTSSRFIANAANAGGAINFGSRINARAVQSLADDMAADFFNANASMNRTLTRFIRATQQRVMEDALISQTIAGGIVEGSARRTVSDALYVSFAKRIDDDELITINGRNYKAKPYSKLVARTRMSEAFNQGRFNGGLSFGMDLYQIDIHGDACPICRTRMGRVYSVSGNHPDFPKLDAKPPFHPNCRCNGFFTTERALRDRGHYEALSALSSGSPQTLNAKEAQKWLDRQKKGSGNVEDLPTFNKALRAEEKELAAAA